MKKQSPAEANYSDAGGNVARRCAICKMFRAPDACSAVAGKIAPLGICNLFVKKFLRPGPPARPR